MVPSGRLGKCRAVAVTGRKGAGPGSRAHRNPSPSGGMAGSGPERGERLAIRNKRCAGAAAIRSARGPSSRRCRIMVAPRWGGGGRVCLLLGMCLRCSSPEDPYAYMMTGGVLTPVSQRAPDPAPDSGRRGSRTAFTVVAYVVVSLPRSSLRSMRTARGRIFACKAAGYGGDRYLSNCNALAYGDYDHGRPSGSTSSGRR